MTQSFDGTILDGTGSIVNFPNLPPEVLDVPSQVINSNARDSGILIIDGKQSAPFSGVYTILTGGNTEYALIKAKEGTVGVLVNNTQTINNVALLTVSKAQQLGNGALRCNLTFELMKV